MMPHMKKMKEPTPAMAKHYRDLFSRNQSKWIRRSKLEPNHIDSGFNLGDQTFQLVGTVNSSDVLIKNVETNDHFMVDIDYVTDAILGKEE